MYLILGAIPLAQRESLLSSPTATLTIIVENSPHITLNTYKKSDGDDPAVLYYALPVKPNDTRQKYRGAFRGPFVLQTFVASLTALQGACKIDGLDDPDKTTARSYGGLPLTVAAVGVAVITYN